MLYVQESGPAAARTVVFLHGGGVSGWMWRPQLALLADYHCLVPDLPEHGESASEGPFTIKDAASRIGELIATKAHGGRASVVGLSLGAQVAVALLAGAPALLDHVIASGTSVRSVPALGLIQAATKLLAPLTRSDFSLRASMRSLRVSEQYLPDFRAEARRASTAALVRVLGENSRFRVPAGLDRITVPTLFVVGEREVKMVRESARELLAAMPAARGYVVPNVGHLWSLEAPDLFAQLVRAWIEDRPLPAGLRSLND